MKQFFNSLWFGNLRHFFRKLLAITNDWPLFMRLLKSCAIFRGYKDEILLLQNKHRNCNSHTSLIFYTMVRCASGFTWEILKMLAREEGMTPIDLGSYYWHYGKSKDDLSCIQAEHVYKLSGYVYGPFRNPHPNVPRSEKYQILLQLRDPRDVLVSHYYSRAFSHFIPRWNPATANEVLTVREKLKRTSIDQDVLENAENVKNIYEKYCRELLAQSNVLFLKYENMIKDFRCWLDQVIEYFEFRIGDSAKERIARYAKFDVPKENIYHCKRQVKPGDHRRKLKPETVAKLNGIFRNVLVELNYETG